MIVPNPQEPSQGMPNLSIHLGAINISVEEAVKVFHPLDRAAGKSKASHMGDKNDLT